ncbi:MAG: hypothetical protein SFW07_04025 [Gammaproteobacteria bacterium]|nr:hypothetical protein [Gammaproteobacteria bacterium]
MAAEKGKEIVLPGVLINELGDLKRKLESQGMSPGLKQEFADIKQKFDASATAARDTGKTALSRVFVKDVSPLVKELEQKLGNNAVQTLPRSSKDKWNKFSEDSIDKKIEKTLSQKGNEQSSKAAEQKPDSPKPSFKMGGHRG